MKEPFICQACGKELDAPDQQHTQEDCIAHLERWPAVRFLTRQLAALQAERQ